MATTHYNGDGSVNFSFGTDFIFLGNFLVSSIKDLVSFLDFSSVVQSYKISFFHWHISSLLCNILFLNSFRTSLFL